MTYTEDAGKKIKEREDEIDVATGKQVDLINKSAHASIQKAERDAALQKQEAERAYTEAVHAADIQKELDLRDIREARANMGLSRSGLSATEQTAAILSAGNKAAQADRQRQAAIDKLNQSLIDYKNEINLQRENNIFSVQQSAAEQKRSYADSKMEWAESMDLDVKQKDEANRLSMLSSMGLDQETLAKAINEGWTVEYTASVKKQQDAQREAELDTAKNDGRISEYICQVSKAQGYTLQQALALQAEQDQTEKSGVTEYTLQLIQSGLLDPSYYNKVLNGEIGMGEILQAASAASTKQNIVAFAEELYGNGLISSTTYTKAQNGTIDIAGIVTESEAYKKKLAQAQTPTTDWRDVIDGYWNKGEGKISDQVHAYAIEYNLSPTRTLDLEEHYPEVLKLMGEKPSRTSKRAAIGYLKRNSVDYELTNFISDMVGLTDADFEDYKKYADSLFTGSAIDAQNVEREELMDEKKWRRDTRN